ncbi:AMP-binding protein [Hungatella hathewayi]|uniref:AMP-binding protein n=1 Tax=Hungatella hathewayi TaxID=154046 RepID=UPI00356571A8
MYKSDSFAISEQIEGNMYDEMTLPEFLCRQNMNEDQGVSFCLITGEVFFYSYRDLYQKALQMLSYLQDRGVHSGDYLILALSDKVDFVLTFWACALGGIYSVPANNDFVIVENYISSFAEQTSVCCIAMESDILTIEEICGRKKHMRGIVYPEPDILKCQPVKEGLICNCRYEDVAMVMFSSGSISSPRGIAITHKMLHHYLVDLQCTMRLNAADVIMGFLPLNHNTALIPFHIFPLFLGIQQYISDIKFMFKDDHSLFDLVFQFKTTVSGTISSHLLKYANFASKENPGWRDSKLHTFFVGAEPISSEAYDFFIQHMEKYGVGRSVVKPAYGLTETTSLITYHQNDKLESIIVDANYLAVGDKVRLVEKSTRNAKCFMPVGEPIHGIDIRIEDECGNVLEDMTVGKVRIKGDSVIRSYYQSKENIGDWLNTGDIGIIKERQLYILGREKDIVIINGKNYFCSDLEIEIASYLKKDTNFITIASYTDTSKMEFDTLLCFLNTTDVRKAELEEYMEKIFCYCIEKYAMRINAFILVSSFLRTPSGKVRRHVMKQKYLNGEIGYTNIVRYGETKIPAKSQEEIQRVIKEIVADYLDCEIGLEESILVYLQDSSGLAKIHLKIDEKYVGALKIVDLIKYPTIKQLSEIIYRYLDNREKSLYS